MLKSKVFKRLASTLLVICFLISAVVVITNTNQKAEASSKLGDISFLRPGFSKESLKSTDLFNKAVTKAIEDYQKKYGGKVNIVYSDWNN